MTWGVVGAFALTGLVANKARKDAKSASNQAAQVSDAAAERADQLEREKFAEAKRQADILRQRGDEASAVALEEASRAELGAQKFEALSNQWAQQIQSTAADQAAQFQTYANKADQSAAQAEQYAKNIYADTKAQAQQKQTYAQNIWKDTNAQSIARQAAGQTAQADILAAAQGVTRAAQGTDARLTAANAEGQQLLSDANSQGQQYYTDALGNITARYSPFIDSERRARGQLDAELGLAPGELNRSYRDTSAYMAAQDASRVAQEEAVATIDQAAGNSGTLYSGTRGAALSDRAAKGSYERAGIEQSYYQNYMSMLQSMANPASTNALSSFESDTAGRRADLGSSTATQRASMGMNTADRISSAYMDAAGTGLNAQVQASQMGLNTMRTGMEGSELLNQMRTGSEGQELLAYLDPGNAGSRDYAMASGLVTNAQGTAGNLVLNGMDRGTSGTDLRLQSQDYLTGAANSGAGVITGNMPTGAAGNTLRLSGSDARLSGVDASNAALADFAGGVGDLATAYMVYGPRAPQTQPAYITQPQTQTVPYKTPTRLYA